MNLPPHSNRRHANRPRPNARRTRHAANSKLHGLELERLEDRTLLTLSAKYLTLLQGAQQAVSLGQDLANSQQAQINIPIISQDLGEVSKLGALFQDTFQPIVTTLTTLRDDAANQDAAAVAFLDNAPLSVTLGGGSALDVLYEASFSKMATLTGASDPLDMGFGGSNPYISQAGTALFNGTVNAAVTGTFQIAFGVTPGNQFYLGAGGFFDDAKLDVNFTLAETTLKIRELPFSVEMGGSAELGMTFDASLNQTLVGAAITAQNLAAGTDFSLGGTAGLTGEVTATILGLEMVGWTADVSWNLATNPEDPQIQDQAF